MVCRIVPDVRRRPRAQPQSHHSIAWCQSRWLRRSPTYFSRGTQFAVRNGSRRQHALCRQHRRSREVRISSGRHAYHDTRGQSRRSSSRSDQSPLDEKRHRQRRRFAPLRDRRIEQQRRRKRHRQRSQPRRHSRNRSEDGRLARLCVRPAQSERPWMGAGNRHIVDRRQRARRIRQQPRSRLSDVRQRRRVLRLALQLLRSARR